LIRREFGGRDFRPSNDDSSREGVAGRAGFGGSDRRFESDVNRRPDGPRIRFGGRHSAVPIRNAVSGRTDSPTQYSNHGDREADSTPPRDENAARGWGRHLRPREHDRVSRQDQVEQSEGQARTPSRPSRPLIRAIGGAGKTTESVFASSDRQARTRQEHDGSFVGFGGSGQRPSYARQQQDRTGIDVAAERKVDLAQYKHAQQQKAQEPEREIQPSFKTSPSASDKQSAAYDIDYDQMTREEKAERSRKDYKKMRFDQDDESDRLGKPRSKKLPAHEGDEARGNHRRSAYDDAEVDDRPRRKKFESAPKAYDATPARRGRMGTEDRRALKYAAPDEEEFEDPELVERRERKRQRQLAKERAAKKAAEVQPIELPPFISVTNLATALRVRLPEFVNKLEELGFEEVANDHVLNFENASLIAAEYNYEALEDRSETEDLKAAPVPEDTSDLPQRPPIVTIMGHVDHGKTTLLDFLRKSSVAASEHGGITQHIGAFSVQMASGKIVTFLDTPGHAAFLSMRQRGANVTDIVILVVAADDSVKPQTIEAIKHARAARVPIIVAINKIDKDEADIQGVKQDLLRHEIEVEDFGGDVQAIPVSGKTGQGLDELEEAMTALAETLDMRAARDGAAEGWVLEATTKLSGRVATVLVRRGTLRVGDVIVAGTTWARVRTLRNEAGVEVAEAPPGTPVEVDGWRDQPSAGDEVLQAPTEQKATSVVRFRQDQIERTKSAEDMEAINESRRLEADRREREKAEKEAADKAAKNNNASSPATTTTTKAGTPPSAEPGTANAPALATPKEDAVTDLYFLIKADVSGSAEAIEGSLSLLPISNHPVGVHLLRTAVGAISASDVDHAASVPNGNGILLSFNQPVPSTMVQLAERKGVRIVDENIIYKVIDVVRGIVEDKLPPVITRRVTGEAEAAAVFDINVGGRKTVKIVGTRVRNGIVKKGGRVKVFRGGVGDEGNVVYEGMLLGIAISFR
jgi:translation initiation factor IF-2